MGSDDLEARYLDAEQIAQKFAIALAGHNFETARDFLSASLQEKYDVVTLKKHFLGMAESYSSRKADAVADPIRIVEVEDLEEEGDYGALYVPISSQDWNEAVTVTVGDYGEGVRIRELEWGRP